MNARDEGISRANMDMFERSAARAFLGSQSVEGKDDHEHPTKPCGISPLAGAVWLLTGASRLHRDRQARFGKELLGSLVQAHQRVIGIAWPRVDGQTSSMAATNALLAFGGMTQHC